MAHHEPSEPTRKRLGARSRQSLFAAAAIVGAAIVRALFSGAGLVGALLLAVGLVAAVLALGWVILTATHRADQGRRDRDPEACFAGKATLYLDQMQQCQPLASAVREAKAGTVRFWTQNQGLLDGELRLDHRVLAWTPMRMARWFRVEPWSLPLDQIDHVEISTGPLPVGPNGIVTVVTASGHFIDMVVTDRHRFASGWEAASQAAARCDTSEEEWARSPRPTRPPHQQPRRRLTLPERVVVAACWPVTWAAVVVVSRLGPDEGRTPGYLMAFALLWLLGMLVTFVGGVVGGRGPRRSVWSPRSTPWGSRWPNMSSRRRRCR